MAEQRDRTDPADEGGQTSPARPAADTIATGPPEEVTSVDRVPGGIGAHPTIADGGSGNGPNGNASARGEGPDTVLDEVRTSPYPPSADTAAPRDEARTRPSEEDDRAALARRIEAALEEGEEAPVIQQDPLLGKTIANRFVVEAKIGAGGMGAVYKASQLGMERHVAIKVLLGEFTNNPLIIKRFHMEALAVSKLEHPNTIRIFDFGQTEEGMLFIAMEYLRGRSLEHDLSAQGTLPVRRALHIMRQTCRALAEAHRKGIVHRDLKPDNIYLADIADDPNFVKVLDFGVAKLKAQDNRQGTLTQAGMVFGTPKYMSPEQSRSDSTDPRSDIYSLGVILYEMLAGRPPFEAENPLSILIKHVQEDAKPFHVVRPDIVIPAPVERIVHRCLTKRPGDRYQDAGSLEEALEEAERQLDGTFDQVVTREDAEALGLDLSRDEAFTRPAEDRAAPGQEDETAPMSPEEAAAVLRRARARRRRRAVGIAAVAVIVIACGVGLALWNNLPGAPPGLQRVLENRQVTLAALPTVEPATVRVVLHSDPRGATVYADEAPIGVAPLEILRLQGQPDVSYTFQKQGHEPQTLPVSFAEDGEYLAQLAKVEPKIVEVERVKVVEKEVPVLTPRATGSRTGKRGGKKPAATAEKPVIRSFTTRKVGDLK